MTDGEVPWRGVPCGGDDVVAVCGDVARDGAGVDELARTGGPPAPCVAPGGTWLVPAEVDGVGVEEDGRVGDALPVGGVAPGGRTNEPDAPDDGGAEGRPYPGCADVLGGPDGWP